MHFFKIVFTVGFSNIPWKYALSKILKTGMNVFKSHSRIIKNPNFLENQLYTNASKKIDDYRLQYLNDLFELTWFFTIWVEYCNFLNLYERYVLWYESFLTIFLKHDKSMISSNYHRISLDVSLYLLLIFANTNFKFNENTFNNIDQSKVLRVPLWIGHCHLCREGHLK